MKYKIDKIELEKIIGACKNFTEQNMSDEYTFLKDEFAPSQSFSDSNSLSMRQIIMPSITTEKPEFDNEYLKGLSLALIMDYNLYANDPSHTTSLLKNMNIENLMTLDPLHKMLPEYRFLKSVIITSKDLSFYFHNPLDIPQIQEIIENSQPDSKFEKQDDNKHVTYGYFNKDNLHFSIGAYDVRIHYKDLIDTGLLKEGLTEGCELVTRIHQDMLIKKHASLVHMHEYQPIFKMVRPEAFNKSLGERLKFIYEAARTGKIENSNEFNETKDSKISHNIHKKYALSKEFLTPHIDYIVINPEMNECYIRFGSNLELGRIKDVLSEQALNEGESIALKERIVRNLKKGAGNRAATRNIKLEGKMIYDQDNNFVAKISGNNIITIPLKSNAQSKTLNLLNTIYDNQLFYTSMENTREIQTNLNNYERNIINSINHLVKIYDLFLSVKVEQEILASNNRVPINGLKWIAQQMQECTDKNYKVKTLYVLNKMDSMIDPTNFSELGRESITQSNAIKLYSDLRLLKGRFETECNKLTPKEYTK